MKITDIEYCSVSIPTARCQLTSSRTSALMSYLAIAWTSLTAQSHCHTHRDWVSNLIWMRLRGIEFAKQLSEPTTFKT